MTEFIRIGPILLNELRDKLKSAATDFDKSATDHGRVSVSNSIRAIIECLQVVLKPEDRVALMPLYQLNYALADLEHGKTPALLRASKVNHRPRDSAAQRAFRAFPAAAMDLLIDGGVQRKQAAQKVARILNGFGYRNDSGKAISGKQVESWRDRILRGAPVEDAQRAQFCWVKESLAGCEDPISAANFLLKRLPGVIPPEIPRKLPS